MGDKTQEEVWDAIAPYWDEYKKRTFPVLEDFLKDKGGKVLDLGCGSGRNCVKLEQDVVYYCVDFSSEMLKLAEKNLKERGVKGEFFHSKSSKIPFDDGFFDYVLCYAMLHCLETKEERIATLKELFRTLKKNGDALITTWGRGSKRIKNRPESGYVPWTLEKDGIKVKRYNYIYEYDELKEEVESVGFEIIEMWEDFNVNVVVRKREA